MTRFLCHNPQTVSNWAELKHSPWTPNKTVVIGAAGPLPLTSCAILICH